jgi:predicted nucleic acid-binding protein
LSSAITAGRRQDFSFSVDDFLVVKTFTERGGDIVYENDMMVVGI